LGEKEEKYNMYMSIDIAIQLANLRSIYDMKKRNNILMWQEMEDVLIVVTLVRIMVLDKKQTFFFCISICMIEDCLVKQFA
jgi:hypothetical protein